MEEIILSIKDINKRYDGRTVYENFNIDFYVNKVNCIVGKSGCGKSTILNIISGIIPNDSNNFTSLESIGLSYIFQEDRLIDWLTVEENIKLVAILNIISGIIPNDSNNFTSLESIGLSYIFQEDRLIDWLTVEENIKLVAKTHYNKEKVEALSQKYLKLVGIEEYKNNYPQMLSGGIRQRVNIARAFIYPSKIIIMDEPFKSKISRN